MNKLLIIPFILNFLSALAQDSCIVKVEIIDSKTYESIPNVSVTLNQNGVSTFRTANHAGFVFVKSLDKEELFFSFTHPVYETEKLNVTVRTKNLDTLSYKVLMQPNKVQHVGEVIVKPKGTPYVVFESNRLSVSDFEINKDGKLILLTYPKRLKKGSELVYYDGQKIINSFEVPERAEELVSDFRGTPHIICENNVFGIYTEKATIGIAKLDKDYFMRYLAPIVDTNKTKMYFSNFDSKYPAFDYYSYDQIDSAYATILHIEDDLMMELYRSEYKWVDVRTKLWAKNKELQTGIDAEVWVGANYFTQSIYYKELFAPMFHRNDSLFVFDYYKDKLFTFNALGEKIDSTGIYHHYQPKANGWKKKVIQDKITGEIYAIYQKDGYSYLGHIDTKTGEIQERVKLEYKFIDKINVYNNFVYYVYRPFESTQKKYLYKEQLPYSFKKKNVYFDNRTSIVTGK